MATKSVKLELHFIDFDKLKVGDKVWVIEDIKERKAKEMKIVSISNISDYPIKCSDGCTYTKEGAYYNTFNTLKYIYASNPFDIKEFPRMMEVSNDGEEWYKKNVIFIKVGGSCIDIYRNTWEMCREIPTKTIVTMEEAKKIVADVKRVDVDTLEIE